MKQPSGQQLGSSIFYLTVRSVCECIVLYFVLRAKKSTHKQSKKKKGCASETEREREVYTRDSWVSQITPQPISFPPPSVAISSFIINYSCVFVSAAWGESLSGSPVGVLCC